MKLDFKRVALAAAMALLCAGCSSRKPNAVVVYTSQDQEFAETIFHKFAQEKQVQVRAVYDNESVKTMGLVRRLDAERAHPRCDLFWSNEALMGAWMATHDLFQPELWSTFGYRSRRIVVNRKLVAPGAEPKNLEELAEARWNGKVAIAYPLFGTTAAHFLALRDLWGDARWRRWCQGLAANGVKLVDGNSVVVRLVGKGEAAVGLTDSDDIAAGIRENGWPIEALPLNAESLLIPNSVGVVEGAPDPAEARRLYAFLQSPEVVRALIAAHALEGAYPSRVKVKTLPVDWRRLSREFDSAAAELRQIFLR